MYTGESEEEGKAELIPVLLTKVQWGQKGINEGMMKRNSSAVFELEKKQVKKRHPLEEECKVRLMGCVRL